MAKSVAGKRPKLVPVSEEMRHICALLAEELLRWPDVSARPMFGLRAFYRGAVVFAMLPDKRALENPKAIAYKLPDGAKRSEGEKWQLCEIRNEYDIDNALGRLEKAYTRAGRRSRTQRDSKRAAAGPRRAD
jgi:hypothetical protein